MDIISVGDVIRRVEIYLEQNAQVALPAMPQLLRLERPGEPAPDVMRPQNGITEYLFSEPWGSGKNSTVITHNQ
jgi:hypothetical protein